MSHFIRVPETFATYAGIDLHTTSLSILAIARHGEQSVRKTIPTHCTGTLLKFIRSLPTPVCVGIESMGSFYWLWDLLLPEVEQIILLDALDLSKMAPRQASTDRTIPARIAYAMRDALVPACYVPGKKIRRLRQFGRQWQAVTEIASVTKVRMRWQLYQENCRGPRQISGASMQRWMQADGDKLEAESCFLIQNWQRALLTMETIRVDLRREMMAIVRGDQVLSHQVELLTRARGIGDLLATIIVAEFGDFGRFKKADSVACWTGLTERSHISNRQKYPGKISKAGSPTLRWALCEAAFEMVCSDQRYHEMYEAIRCKTGKAAIARTAMGRRLSRYIWKAVVSDKPLRIGESRKRTQRANEVRQRRSRNKKRLEEKIVQRERTDQPVTV